MNSLQQVQFDRQPNSGSQFRSRRRNCEQFQPWQLRHETNGRKWKGHCSGLLRVLNALIYIGPERATEKEICNMSGFKGRTVRKWLRVARLRNLIADEEWVPNSRGLDHVKRVLELAPLRAMRPRSNRAGSTPRIVPGLGPRIVPPKYLTKPKFKSSGVPTSFHHPETPQPDDEKKVCAQNPQILYRNEARATLRIRYPKATDAAFDAAFDEGYANRISEPNSAKWYITCFERKQISLRLEREKAVEQEPSLSRQEVRAFLARNAMRVNAVGIAKPEIASCLKKTVEQLDDLINELDLSENTIDFNEIERRLTEIENALVKVLLASLPEEFVLSAGRKFENQLMQYRQKLNPSQVDQLHGAMWTRCVIEHYGLSRLSLFYIDHDRELVN